MKNENPYDIFDLMWSSSAMMPDPEDIIDDKEIIHKLKKDFDLEIVDEDGRSLLMNSVIYERSLVVEYLLSTGANVNQVDQDGFSALHFAVQTNNINIIKRLLASGADTNLKNGFGNNAIMLTDNGTSIEILKLLLSYGSDPYQKNNYGISAIDIMGSEITNLLNEK